MQRHKLLSATTRSRITATRSIWSHATRPLQVRQVAADGATTSFATSPSELVASHGLLPRDLRLLSTRGANIAVRPGYFLFRLPPFTGCVQNERALLLFATSPSEGGGIAAEVLQATISSQLSVGSDAPFELLVLEAALREDLISKQERFTRLSTLIRTVSAQRGGAAAGWMAGLPSEAGAEGSALASPPQPVRSLFARVEGGGDSGNEHALYRLLTLSNSLAALELDVRRTFTALTTLLGSDEDMSALYLSEAARTGAARPVERHEEVELMLEAYATQLEDLLDRVSALRETVATQVRARALHSDRTGVASPHGPHGSPPPVPITIAAPHHTPTRDCRRSARWRSSS